MTLPTICPPDPVLIVDDDPVTLKLVTGALQSHGVGEIQTISTLTEAGNAISLRSFSAAIVDLHLPDGNGMEFVHMVRRGLTSQNRDMVVIVSSAYLSPRTAGLLLRLGATEIMRKPPDIERIVELLGVRQAA